MSQNGIPIYNVEDGFDLEPLGDQIYLEIINPNTSKGGLVIPQTASSSGFTSSQAVVMKTGPGAYNANGTINPLPVKPGDTVWLPEHMATNPYLMPIGIRKRDGRMFLLCRASGLMAKLLLPAVNTNVPEVLESSADSLRAQAGV